MMTDPATPDAAGESSERAAAAIAASRAARSKPAKPARGGRFLAAGAAVGLSLAAVGAMSAAADIGEAPPTPAATIQRVVVPQPAPQQIVIVLPGADAATGTPVTVGTPSMEITAPPKPTPPAATSETAPAPITESEAS